MTLGPGMRDFEKAFRPRVLHGSVEQDHRSLEEWCVDVHSFFFWDSVRPPFFAPCTLPQSGMSVQKAGREGGAGLRASCEATAICCSDLGGLCRVVRNAGHVMLSC